MGRRQRPRMVSPDPGELRQGALVFDWLQESDSATTPEASDRIKGLAAGAERANGLRRQRCRRRARRGILAAIALAGHWDGSEPTLGTLLT